MFKKFFIIITFLVLASLNSFAQPQAPTPHVDVFEIKGAEPFTFEATYPAKVRAVNTATVVAKVSGTIMKQYVNEGDFVNKDDMLFKIDDEVYSAEVEVIKSQLEVAKVKLEQAKTDFARVSKSYKENVVSEQDYDNARFALAQAQANVALINSQLKRAQIDLSYTNIIATEKGFAGIKMVDIGDYVTPGTPVIQLTDSTKVYVDFSLPDRDFEKIRTSLNDLSNITMGIQDKQYLSGKITFIDSKMDERTSTVKVRALYDNKERVLTPGMFIRLNLNISTSEQLVKLPQKAILQNPNGIVCFAIDDNNTVNVKPVQIVESKNDFYFVKGPFKPNEKIVLNNFFRIKPGAKVIVDKIIQQEEN